MKKSILFLWFTLLAYSGFLWADMRVDEGVEILKAAKAETSLSDHEKLYVYRCDMLRKYVGFPDTPIGQAKKHSCNQPHIGIAFYASDDLGKHSPQKIATYFEDEFYKHDIEAKVFINSNWPHGSSMGFYVNGESQLKTPLRPSQALEEIEAIAADSLLLLYTKGRIKEWPHGKPPRP